MTFIIAEVGSNWESLEDAKDSIAMAKNCGADAVKFQLYTSKELYGFGELKGQGELPKDWLPKLKEKADACGIELACTAFSPEGVNYVDQFVKRHKIASSELSDPTILRAVKEKNKPIILSTGGSSITDIALALNELSGSKVTLLYCRANYPAKNIDLEGINKLRQTFFSQDIRIGYSCHSTEWTTPVFAARHYKAEVIEKHFKLREMDTPDNPHSLTPTDFKLMVKKIRGDSFVAMPDFEEKDMQLKHKRRLIVTKPIAFGEELKFGVNYGIYRSLKEDYNGLTGFAFEYPNGKAASRDLSPGDPIGPSDFR